MVKNIPQGLTGAECVLESRTIIQLQCNPYLRDNIHVYRRYTHTHLLVKQFMKLVQDHIWQTEIWPLSLVSANAAEQQVFVAFNTYKQHL